MTRRIFRARDRKRYLIVEQAAVEDSRLSWAARGLLVYLLAKPDSWLVIVNDLVKRGNLGRDGVYRLLAELKEHGYVRYAKHRDPQGRLRGGHYVVYERPPDDAPAPHPELPQAAVPEPDQPEPARPDALSITYQIKKPTITQLPTPTDSKSEPKPRTGTAHYVFPPSVSAQDQASASCIVASLAAEVRQPTLDEWGQALASGAVRSSALGYLDAMVKRRLAAAEIVPQQRTV